MINIDKLGCESFIALTSDSELFLKIIDDIFTNGKSSSNNLKYVTSEFANFGCMDSYWNWASSTRLINDFYFGFFLQPDWVEKVVDEFNSKFKNFSIEIVYKKDWNIINKKDWYDFSFYYTNDSKKEVHSKAGGYIYKLNSHIEIEFYTKRKIFYLFHHFFRSISISERIFQLGDPTPHTNYIEFVLSKNNKAPGSRSLTDYFANEDDFLALDDEEVLESFTNLVYTGTLKQSDTLYIAGQIKRHGREYFEEIPWERGGIPKHPKTLYGIFLSDRGFVYIRKKPISGKLLYTNGYYSNPGIIFHAGIQVNFVNSKISEIPKRNCYNEGSLKNYQLFPLVDIYNRYPELGNEIVPKLVELVNKNLGGKFRTPKKEDFIVE
jgi:hypothetical protein